MNRNYLCALSLVASWMGSVAFAAPPQYAVVDLGLWEAGEGLVWPQLVATQAFGNPGLGGNNFIYALNTAAEVGYSSSASSSPYTEIHHAARWVSTPETAIFTDLGVLPNAAAYERGPWSYAYGLNLSGDIVGQSDTQYLNPNGGPSHSTHAFLWNNGTMSDLGAIAGNAYDSVAYSVNDSHEVVGSTTTISSVDGSQLTRAFIYTGGTMYNLTFYLVGGPTVLLNQALAINCQGNIAAAGYPAGSTVPYPVHNYLLVRQGPARTGCS